MPNTNLEKHKNFDADSTSRIDIDSSGQTLTKQPHESGYQKPGYYEEYDEFENHGSNNDNVQMTFDTSFNSPPGPARSHSQPVLSGDPPKAESPTRSAALRRPELENCVTMPTVSLEHNAWLEEDEDFGDGKEIKMTFE